MADSKTVSATLPGMELGRVEGSAPEGTLQHSVALQVRALQTMGYIEEHHAAQVHLALVAARDIDMSTGRGAPSGRANLLRVMNEILERLPQPEAASVDKLGEVLTVLQGASEDNDY